MAAYKTADDCSPNDHDDFPMKRRRPLEYGDSVTPKVFRSQIGGTSRFDP
jgi:hypothetical protein